jgi:hypothetical protein
VRLASAYVLPSQVEAFSGGAMTNAFLASRGFVVVDKRGSLSGVMASPESDSDAFPEGKETYRRHRARTQFHGCAPG